MIADDEWDFDSLACRPLDTATGGKDVVIWEILAEAAEKGTLALGSLEERETSLAGCVRIAEHWDIAAHKSS